MLRRQAARYHCPDCGKTLANCGLDLVSGSDAEAVVRITCPHCEASHLVAVQAATVTAEPPPSVRDEPLPGRAPLTADDVLDARLALADHRGDLLSLLSK